jgi:hypothetical protein
MSVRFRDTDPRPPHHRTDLGFATADARWSKPCSLMGCTRPRIAHHHHYYRGHLETVACACDRGGEPGTAGLAT